MTGFSGRCARSSEFNCSRVRSGFSSKNSTALLTISLSIFLAIAPSLASLNSHPVFARFDAVPALNPRTSATAKKSSSVLWASKSRCGSVSEINCYGPRIDISIKT